MSNPQRGKGKGRSQATDWSKWEYQEDPKGNYWYCWRKDENGEVEYSYGEPEPDVQDSAQALPTKDTWDSNQHGVYDTCKSRLHERKS